MKVSVEEEGIVIEYLDNLSEKDRIVRVRNDDSGDGVWVEEGSALPGQKLEVEHMSLSKIRALAAAVELLHI